MIVIHVKISELSTIDISPHFKGNIMAKSQLGAIADKGT